MSLTTIRSPPPLSDFTPLAEHQEKTPESFYDEKPILYYHGAGAKAWISKSQRGKLPFFPADLESAPSAPESSALSDATEELVEQKVDLFVNSQNLTIFSPAAESGLTIPYPQISIHAIKTLSGPDGAKYGSVYVQLELAEGGSDEEFDLVELTLIPPAAAPSPEQATEESGIAAAPKPKSETTKLFEAISECSNLNPDPVDQDDEDEDENGGRIIFEGDLETVEGFTGVFAGANDGGLPPALPGSGGWITAENVHEYFDADGNWIGGGPEEEEEEVISGELGDGAGAVHGRDEEQNVNGQEGQEGQEEGDSKRVRRE
ncbi:regulator of volume decrease after cellular swelling-domain-containing protein [Podospora australis]|uniref:Regulator of volume decrease after cellular swelling-domain-containing protein n=1 Tax=Podospora australis TaxID=1536484 RepID=A0AAN6WZT4_9PEZI|nr:regulator of volume decrease after cellular swelling-domain-containing protein [Podospora australis]